MQSYQLQGLHWMASLHHNGLNDILADEMGLSKTLQTILFLRFFKHYHSVSGPHPVVVPKFQNRNREFGQWVPDFNVVILPGSKEGRAEITANWVIPQDFEVCIRSYNLQDLPHRAERAEEIQF